MEGLNDLLKMASQKLGVAIDVLQANGMEYVKDYAHYTYMNNIMGNIFFGVLLAVLVAIIGGFIFFLIDDTVYGCSPVFTRVYTTILVIICLLIMVAPLVQETLSYTASPVMYGLEHILEKTK